MWLEEAGAQRDNYWKHIKTHFCQDKYSQRNVNLNEVVQGSVWGEHTLLPFHVPSWKRWGETQK